MHKTTIFAPRKIQQTEGLAEEVPSLKKENNETEAFYRRTIDKLTSSNYVLSCNNKELVQTGASLSRKIDYMIAGINDHFQLTSIQEKYLAEING